MPRSRYPRRRKRSTRTRSRRSSAKTRPYRRTKRTSRPMNKKRILNVTSTKKRNGMLTWSNTASSGASATVAVNPAYVNGVGTGFFLWNATAQDLSHTSGADNTITQSAARTATTCYMRGLAENIRIQTSSGLPWFWRRICFTSKGSVAPLSTQDSPTQTARTYQDTSNGMVRLFFNTDVNNMPNTKNNLDAVIFKGAKGVDWNDFIVAPVDTARVTLKYDRTRTLKSGNANGTVHEAKLWHPMAKNLVYDDDESGDFEASSYVSTQSKAGMGDYYVLDIISPGTGGATTDALLIQANSTLYWHEK
uniref:Putative coat protein n=1 Tax=Prunella montanella Genomoviridae sp. TaxID=2814991 RepID=A0A8E7L4B2_9VIRU|nr:MAG: capsid protein [Gemycircularvirus]